jgi:hypothetical protein
MPGATFEEQRHPGKPGAAITRTGHKLDSVGSNGRSNSAPPTTTVKSDKSGYLRSESGLNSSQKESSDAPLFNSKEAGGGEGMPEKRQDETLAEKRSDGSLGQEEREEEEKVYPRPLASTLIIIGLCLSVFLISLDRTIITTVRAQAPS